jgi:hypothetical protein
MIDNHAQTKTETPPLSAGRAEPGTHPWGAAPRKAILGQHIGHVPNSEVGR